MLFRPRTHINKKKSVILRLNSKKSSWPLFDESLWYRQGYSPNWILKYKYIQVCVTNINRRAVFISVHRYLRT